jgi:hypothetical protein
VIWEWLTGSRWQSKPSTFPLFQPGTNLIGIEQLSPLRRRIAFLDLCPNLAAMLGQPGFLLVKQRNGVLHELIHGLVGPALNVPLDHLFQLGSQMNLHSHSLPQPDGAHSRFLHAAASALL